MGRSSASVLLLFSLGLVCQVSHAVEVNVTDKDNQLCLYANLRVNFSVEYEAAADKSATVEFELPSDITTDGSKCDPNSSLLKLNFGVGHSLSVNFTIIGQTYQADSISFTYNLSDSSLFPNSQSNETASVTAKPQITNVGLNTCYSCRSKDLIPAGVVNLTLSDVLMQAFVVNGSKSEIITSCSADQTTTSAPPTTHTTETPVTTVTTAPPPPTTTATPPLPEPTTKTYNISADNSTCLLVKFGLRIGFNQGQDYQEMNLEPNKTTATGLCGVNSSELQLVSDSMTLVFTFTNNSAKFLLHAINVTVKTSSGVEFKESNSNLSLWEAALGSSYLCNKKQDYNISNTLSLYTFNLQVQPFGVSNGDFSTATECSLDDTSILIPIIVGAVLAGLILIVVIAYVIGRRKTYVGYQTL